jgi:DNA-binding beta-propeller fold protein YncE
MRVPGLRLPETLTRLLPSGDRIFPVAALGLILSVAPAGSAEIYAPNCFDGDISIVDTDLLQEVGRIPVFDPTRRCPTSLVFSGDGQLAFVYVQPGEVDVLDLRTGTDIERIATHPKTPLGALIFSNPDLSRLYVTDCAGTTITVLDPVTREMVDVLPATSDVDGIDIPDGPWRMGFTSDGVHGFTHSCTFVTGVRRIDLTTNLEDGFLPLDELLRSVQVSPTDRIVVAIGDTRLHVIDPDLLTEIGRLDVADEGLGGASLHQVAFSPDGGLAYVVDFLGKRFLTVDLADPVNPWLVSAVPIGTPGNLVDVLIDGDRAYLMSWRGSLRGEIIVMDITQAPPVPIGSIPIGSGAITLALRPQASADPEMILGEAIDQIGSLDVPRGIANSLVVKLERVLALLATGDTRDGARAIRMLEAFMHEVAALRGKALSEAEADRLAELAAEALTLLLGEA